MTMSILRRITGGALYVGTVLVAWWLVAAATSESQFGFVDWLVRSWFGKLALLGYTWAMFHHMLGGIRHFVWDTGAGMEKQTALKLGWATLVGSIVLTVVAWAVYLVIA
jgi:succinate dehydrogenase / fumarate reductase cytochrome b subunit